MKPPVVKPPGASRLFYYIQLERIAISALTAIGHGYYRITAVAALGVMDAALLFALWYALFFARATTL